MSRAAALNEIPGTACSAYPTLDKLVRGVIHQMVKILVAQRKVVGRDGFLFFEAKQQQRRKSFLGRRKVAKVQERPVLLFFFSFCGKLAMPSVLVGLPDCLVFRRNKSKVELVCNDKTLGGWEGGG